MIVTSELIDTSKNRRCRACAGQVRCCRREVVTAVWQWARDVAPSSCAVCYRSADFSRSVEYSDRAARFSRPGELHRIIRGDIVKDASRGIVIYSRGAATD